MRSSFRLASAGVLALFAALASAQGPSPTPTGGQGGGKPGPGRRYPPPIQVGPGLVFGAVEVGQTTPSQVVTITNISSQPVGIQSITASGPGAADFAGSFGPSLPFVLGVGQSEPITVTFQPSALGLRRATIRVSFAGPPNYPVSATVRGVGIGPVGDETRVDAGGPKHVDALGQEWTAEYGFAGGFKFYSPAPVAGTPEQFLFGWQRYGTSFDYGLPIPDGAYAVTLHFAELQLPVAGARVFDVAAEGTLVVDDLDLFAEAGFATATARTFETVVADGVLDLAFSASTGFATVSAIEVQGVGKLDAAPGVVDFGAVDGGGSAQQTIALTNVGLLPLTIDTLSLLIGPAGTAASMTASLAGGSYPGAASDVGYAVDVTLAPGASVPLDVVFAPAVEQYDECTLRLGGAFTPVEVTLKGLGGHVGHPFLHVVIDVPPFAVDFDGDGFEPVVLDGSQSHTHAPGGSLVGYSWTEGGIEIATAPVATVNFPLGGHDVTLEITDDSVPAESLDGDASFVVIPSSEIPGVLVRYYDALTAGTTPAALVYSMPPNADFAEIAPTTFIDGLTTVGGSPFGRDVAVRFNAEITLPQAARYEFKANGGSLRFVALNGILLAGPVNLPAGTYRLEARFAVDLPGQLPVEVLVGVNGAAPGSIDPAWLEHDESGILPVINAMPTVGTSLGGNVITIEGLGFFPKDQVVVRWGAQQFAQPFFDSLADDEIVFVSPPGQGTVAVRVETPNGVSNEWQFTYDQSGPVPVNFVDAGATFAGDVTCGTWGADGRFYAGRLDGKIAAFDFNDDYSVQSVTIYDGVSGLSNNCILGITTNPHDPPSPVKLYVAHSELWAQGGTSFVGPAPYPGQVSVLSGTTFDAPVPLITGLPTSNHDHAVNGLVFDHNGDLLICVGSNTNAGVKHPNSGDLVESPLAAAILKAETSRPDFNGAITYELSDGGGFSTDQVEGEIVDVSDGVHVAVHAPGLRNPLDLVYTTAKRLYATDNGPNFGFGAASTGPASEDPDPQDKDELCLVEADNYYGHPNRARGRYDARQYVYRDGTEPGLPDAFTQTLIQLTSSVNGVTEYRANTFQGQMRGDLIAQKFGSFLQRIELAPDGRSVTGFSQIFPWTGSLGVETGPGGALLALSEGLKYVKVLVPDDLSAVGLVVHDVHPWRGPETGGTPFVLGGVGFGTLADTSVSFDGVPAVLSEVTPTRVRGTVPAHAGHDGELVDVVVTVGAASATLTEAYRYLYPPGNELGEWEALPDVPNFLGEVACGVVDGVLHLVGGNAPTYRYDVAQKSWLANGAPRPFAGDHHGAEVVDGKLYLFGGLGGGSGGKVQVYDPAFDSWSVAADMPWGGGSVSTALIDGQVYVAGGIVGGLTVTNHSRYDPVLDAWFPLAPMPVGRNHTAAGTDGEKFYAIGGRDGGNQTTNGFDDVQVYDPATDTWAWDKDGVSGLAPLPQFRGGMGKAVYFGGELYVFGGETLDGPGAVPGKNVYDRVDVYDPATNTWRLEKPMPVPRHGIFPVLFESRMFVAAGGVQAAASGSNTLDAFTRQ